MRKKLIMSLLGGIMTLSIAACGAGGAGQTNTEAEISQSTSGGQNAGETQSTGQSQAVDGGESSASSKILIAYFTAAENSGVDASSSASYSVVDGEEKGRLRAVADMIQDETAGELFSIQTEAVYAADIGELIEYAQEEQNNDVRPGLSSQIEDFDSYDVVFVGFPTWWYDMPQAMYSFFDEYDFTGKTLIPFNVHNGSRFSGTIETIQELEPGAEVVTDGFTVHERDVAEAAGDVTEWLDGLGYTGQEAASEAVSAAVIGTGTVTSVEDLTFPLGQQINSDSFIGAAYLAPMIANDDIYHFPQTNNVTFEPGARSSWHSHGGMLILVTGGVGYYQEEGQPAQIIRTGDVIECEPGVRHWHGAAPDSWFSQMVIYDSHYAPEEGSAALDEPVTDEYYASLTAEEITGRTVTDENEFMFQRAENAMNMETFSGPAYVSSLIGADNAAGSPDLHYVVFDRAVINNWHTHEGGQIMIATDGIGYHQIEGEPVEILYPGDVAQCPPGVRHWHGGSADTEFAHIAVNTNPELRGLEWFERISDEEYQALPTEKES